MDAALFSSARTDWETPKALFDKLNEEFHFTLVPASTDENALCKKHFTPRCGKWMEKYPKDSE